MARLHGSVAAELEPGAGRAKGPKGSGGAWQEGSWGLRGFSFHTGINALIPPSSFPSPLTRVVVCLLHVHMHTHAYTYIRQSHQLCTCTQQTFVCTHPDTHQAPCTHTRRPQCCPGPSRQQHMVRCLKAQFCQLGTFRVGSFPSKK